jgi:hypothetical protein
MLNSLVKTNYALTASQLLFSRTMALKQTLRHSQERERDAAERSFEFRQHLQEVSLLSTFDILTFFCHSNAMRQQLRCVVIARVTLCT